MARSDLARKKRDDHHILLFGCGGVTLLFFFLVALLLLLVLRQERESARYPGAISISAHSNYSSLPFEYRWDDVYLADDNFRAVYNWYSTTFDLGSESRALGRCSYLDGSREQFLVRRTVNVLLCDTPDGQMIYVTRFTTLNR